MRNNLQHPVNCETGELNPPATAPDSAMRQEAVSEPQMEANRQRKGTPHAVEHRHTMACHAPPRCKRVEPASAEASRLLEGESK